MPDTAELLRAAAIPLATGDGSEPADIDKILELIGNARIVLIGEASHGTHEFYATRAAITRALVERRGFRAVAIEGDWPETRRVHRYVTGREGDASADEALSGYKRFPQWMWRNGVVCDFVNWLRDWNDHHHRAAQCGFYGLDLYSLHASIDAVLRYLERVDPPAAERARSRYACFDHVGSDDPQAYGYAATRSFAPSCADDVVRQLSELRHCADEYAGAGAFAEDDFFSAEQNARLVANAERYYRSMFHGRVSSWNLRDTHMVETLAAVHDFLERDGDARIVVWAHNSHLGDARATQMGKGGELNVGQLVRQQFGRDACLIGFSTHAGSVTAARDWDHPGERRRVRPSLRGSVENLFHSLAMPRFVVDLRAREVQEALHAPLLERAIGVIYRPETERQSHYFQVELAEQFDVMIHIDVTRALEPLEPSDVWHRGESDLPDTYPSSL